MNTLHRLLPIKFSLQRQASDSSPSTPPPATKATPGWITCDPWMGLYFDDASRD